MEDDVSHTQPTRPIPYINACFLVQEGFIVDIDSIQAHGFRPRDTARVSLQDSALTGFLGIGAADITKLKANGFYTVAVCIPSSCFATLTRFQSVTPPD
jgi:hypothetical protein